MRPLDYSMALSNVARTDSEQPLCHYYTETAQNFTKSIVKEPFDAKSDIQAPAECRREVCRLQIKQQ